MYNELIVEPDAAGQWWAASRVLYMGLALAVQPCSTALEAESAWLVGTGRSWYPDAALVHEA